MARDSFLTYYIVLTDADQVAAYQAQYPHGVLRAPYNAAINGGAAVEFAAPWTNWRVLPGGPPPPEAPYTWSPWSSSSAAGDHPFPIDVATFTRHSGGFWGIGGTTVHYYWIGEFIYAGSTTAPPGGSVGANAPLLEIAPLSLRRFIDGFEVPQGGPAGRTGTGGGYSFIYDAGRTPGGRGLALRGSNNNGVSVAPNKYRAVTSPSGWDRMYVRLRRLPAISVNFWSTSGTPTALNGIALDINPSGQLTVYTSASGGAGRSVLGTIDPPLPVWTGLSTDDAWRRLDLLYEYANGNPNGYFRIWIDGALQATFVITGSGLGSGTSIQSVNIGETFSVGANTLELDVDDWVSSDLPPGQDSNAVNGVGRPYLYDPNALYIIDDLVHTTDGHVYKCIKAIATAVPADGTPVPSLRAGGTFWHRYEGQDWLYGSRILLTKPKAFGAAHSVNWTGNYRTLQQNGFFHQSTTAATLTSSTAGAVAEAEMDVAEMIDTETNAIGAVALLVVADSFRGANSGSLGYNINAAGAVDTAVTETATPGAYISVLYPGPVGVSLVDISPLQLRYTKGSSADAATLRNLLGQVELLGVFDRHDYRPTPDGGAWDGTLVYAAGDVVERKRVWYRALSAVIAGKDPSDPTNVAFWQAVTLPAFPQFVGQHNAPYRRSSYVIGALAAPTAPYIVHAGTYVGNATFQDLVFRAPVGLLFIRPLTGGAGGYIWASTLEAGHVASQQATVPTLTDAAEDLTFVPVAGEDSQQKRYVVRISGSGSQVNANAVTYQYIAIEDPGARFMLNTSLSHHQSLAADADNPLIDPTFLADWAFAVVESLDASASIRFYGKGPGNAAQTIVPINGTAVASALALATGKVTTKSAFHALGATGLFGLSLWRKADGNNDPGQPGVVNIGTYTGDGSASRTINLSPVSGKRPLFALFFSEAATGFWRDPSHTTTNSTNSAGADLTTGITGGGIDSISVGSALNTNGVIYNYFVLFAGATACNGGWGCNGEYIPVEATPPASGPWPPNPNPTEYVPTVPPPEPLPNEPDLEAACVASTQRLVNIALSRIGVSKVIADLVAENTMEAAIARLHVKYDVEAVLADFPWPFATRYAELVLVGGTEDDPVNVDWQYSYRAPADLVIARRLGGQLYQRRAYDPDPITFRYGTDATGGLIYSNAAIDADTPLVLEYTARASCPAATGSALFKDALAWRFAASLAMPLARDSQKQRDCEVMYERVLARAEAVAANESQQDKGGDAPWITDRS